MSSFCIASLLSPTPKSNPSRPSSSQKLSPTSKSAIDINMPVLGAAPLLSAADLLQMASASMMSPYNQPNLASVFNPAALSHPTAYPFAQLPPFFVNGFPPNGYFGPNAGLFQPNGMILQQLSGRRKRRHRTIFTDEQLAILESNFSANAYPDIALREKLAIQCDLKEERVEVWFKNRRAKERKKRHDFSNGENATRDSTDNGAVSPFFEQSSSSEHKLSDESDAEDYKSTFVSSDIKLLTKLPTPEVPTQQPTSTPNKRKKPHSDTKEEPVVKRVRPSPTDKSQVKVD